MMNETVLMDDPMEEIYAIRRELSSQYGHDVYRLAEAAKEWMKRDQASGIRYVRLPIARREKNMV